MYDIILPADRQEEILEDRSSSGRVRPWAEHKRNNELLAMLYDQLRPDKAARLRECATVLTFAVGEDGRRLQSANFCRVRLCPVCAWRRSLKVYAQMSSVLAAMTVEDCAYLHVVLTVRNVLGDDLTPTIDNMMSAWVRFRRSLGAIGVVLGWYRALEVAHNTDTDSAWYDTYHPHYHCIFAVPRGYFGGRLYIPQSGWADLWRRAARLDYPPDVYVHKIDGSSVAAVTRAICEIAKYTTKPGEYIIPDDWDLSLDAVRVLDAALHRRRLVAFGGIIGDYHRRLQLDDPDSGDLVHIDPEQVGADPLERIVYAWHSGYRQYIRR